MSRIFRCNHCDARFKVGVVLCTYEGTISMCATCAEECTGCFAAFAESITETRDRKRPRFHDHRRSPHFPD